MKSFIQHITEALEGSKMKYSGKNREFVDVIMQNTEGKILILRRSNYMKNFRTCWGVIGGAVEENKDKTHKDAAIRETREETGYELSFMEQNNMKHLFDYTYKDGNISHVYLVKLESDINVKISKEHSKYEWVDFSEEKIDDRKWMPEVFSILQKWEQTPVNEKLVINQRFDEKLVINQRLDEKLVINKNYHVEHYTIDDLIEKYVDFNEGVEHSQQTLNLKYNLKLKIDRLAQNHSLLFDVSEKNTWQKECIKHMCLDDGTGYTFNSGELVRTRKVKSLMPNAESIEELITHIDENDKQIIYSEEDIDGTLFEVFYVIGEQYTFVTLGSTELRYSYITSTKKN